MARSLRSLTLPNDQWTAHSQADLDAILALQPDGLLALAYPGSDSQADRILQEGRLLWSLAKPPFILRAYAENILSFNPRDWARDCYVLVRSYLDMNIEVDGLIPWNEPNIEGLQDDHWPALLAFENLFATEYRKLDSLTLLHRPALSPIENYRDGYYFRAGTGGLAEFDVVDVHVYSGQQLTDVEFLHRLFPDKPICVSEYNFASWGLPRPTIQEFLINLPPYVETACYFTSRWRTPPEGSPDVDLLTKPELCQEFMAVSGQPQPLPTSQPHPGEPGGISEGGDMALKDQYPDAFAAWEAAGGVEDNFAAHLRGIGVLPPTIQGALDSLDRAEASIRQARNILGGLPPL